MKEGYLKSMWVKLSHLGSVTVKQDIYVSLLCENMSFVVLDVIKADGITFKLKFDNLDVVSEISTHQKNKALPVPLEFSLIACTKTLSTVLSRSVRR